MFFGRCVLLVLLLVGLQSSCGNSFSALTYRRFIVNRPVRLSINHIRQDGNRGGRSVVDRIQGSKKLTEF